MISMTYERLFWYDILHNLMKSKENVMSGPDGKMAKVFV
jgi:hypothetical protein